MQRDITDFHKTSFIFLFLLFLLLLIRFALKFRHIFLRFCLSWSSLSVSPTGTHSSDHAVNALLTDTHNSDHAVNALPTDTHTIQTTLLTHYQLTHTIQTMLLTHYQLTHTVQTMLLTHYPHLHPQMFLSHESYSTLQLNKTTRTLLVSEFIDSWNKHVCRHSI